MFIYRFLQIPNIFLLPVLDNLKCIKRQFVYKRPKLDALLYQVIIGTPKQGAEEFCKISFFLLETSVVLIM